MILLVYVIDESEGRSGSETIILATGDLMI